jgi:predicted dienelactone hydrolase
VLLARSGDLVALPRHPGDTLGNNELAQTGDNLRNRPAQLVALLYGLLSDTTLGESIAEEPVIAMGHSMGGYTVLSVAGGQPWTRSREPIPVAHDSRIGALVLMAPACGPFPAPHCLAQVTVPILALTAQHDYLTPDSEIRRALAGITEQRQVTIQTVPNAGHFSFLSPFPREMRSAQFEPGMDPSGFDRERFHQWLPDLVHKWIRERRDERGTLARR